VLFLYQSIDDFVMSNLIEFQTKKLLSIETSQSDVVKKPPTTDTDFVKWLKQALSKRVSAVRVSDRLVTSPAIIVDHESATFRRMMRFADPKHAPSIPKQILEINIEHPIIVKLDSLRMTNPSLASEIAEQVTDNAMIAAGLLDDARTILPRMNRLMEALLSNTTDSTAVEKTPVITDTQTNVENVNQTKESGIEDEVDENLLSETDEDEAPFTKEAQEIKKIDK